MRNTSHWQSLFPWRSAHGLQTIRNVWTGQKRNTSVLSLIRFDASITDAVVSLQMSIEYFKSCCVKQEPLPFLDLREGRWKRFPERIRYFEKAGEFPRSLQGAWIVFHHLFPFSLYLAVWTVLFGERRMRKNYVQITCHWVKNKLCKSKFATLTRSRLLLLNVLEIVTASVRINLIHLPNLSALSRISAWFLYFTFSFPEKSFQNSSARCYLSNALQEWWKSKNFGPNCHGADGYHHFNIDEYVWLENYTFSNGLDMQYDECCNADSGI